MNSKDEIMEMPAEVDFSDSIPNPYIGKVRRRVTMNIDGDNIDYFKAESAVRACRTKSSSTCFSPSVANRESILHSPSVLVGEWREVRRRDTLG